MRIDILEPVMDTPLQSNESKHSLISCSQHFHDSHGTSQATSEDVSGPWGPGVLRCWNQTLPGIVLCKVLVGFDGGQTSNSGAEGEKDAGLKGIRHLDHCIDSIWQSLVCLWDIFTIIWNGIRVLGMLSPMWMSPTPITTDMIHQWVLENQAPKWNQSIYVPDLLQE